MFVFSTLWLPPCYCYYFHFCLIYCVFLFYSYISFSPRAPLFCSFCCVFVFTSFHGSFASLSFSSGEQWIAVNLRIARVSISGRTRTVQHGMAWHDWDMYRCCFGGDINFVSKSSAWQRWKQTICFPFVGFLLFDYFYFFFSFSWVDLGWDGMV